MKIRSTIAVVLPVAILSSSTFAASVFDVQSSKLSVLQSNTDLNSLAACTQLGLLTSEVFAVLNKDNAAEGGALLNQIVNEVDVRDCQQLAAKELADSSVIRNDRLSFRAPDDLDLVKRASPGQPSGGSFRGVFVETGKAVATYVATKVSDAAWEYTRDVGIPRVQYQRAANEAGEYIRTQASQSGALGRTSISAEIGSDRSSGGGDFFDRNALFMAGDDKDMPTIPAATKLDQKSFEKSLDY